jgi:rare lipoprotein A
LTASGEVFDPYGFTAAHRTLPFGTQLSVRYGGRSVLVTVNDRGPSIRGRDLDLSQGAAEYLGLTSAGVDWVHYTVVGKAGYRAGHSADYGANNTHDFSRDGPGYASARSARGGSSYYVVRPGDTLSGIAARFGTSVHYLASANGIEDPDFITVGEKIYY